MPVFTKTFALIVALFMSVIADTQAQETGSSPQH